MKTITRFTQIFVFLLAAASAPPTVAADTDLVVWTFGSGIGIFYNRTPAPIGVVTGTFTYALGGDGPTDWNIQIPAFPPIVNLFFGLPALTLTPANSSSATSSSSVFRLTSTPLTLNGPSLLFEIDPLSSTSTPPFNQPGSIFPLVAAQYSTGPTALSNNGFGSNAPPIFGAIAVPEPETYAMLALGLGVLALARRRTPRS